MCWRDQRAGATSCYAVWPPEVGVVLCVCLCAHTRVWCVWYELIQDSLLSLMKCLFSSLACVLSKIILLSWQRVLSVPYVVESSPLSDTSFTILPSSVTFVFVHLLRRLSHSFELFLWPFELCVTVVWTYMCMCLWVFYFVTATYAFCYCNCIPSPETT